MPALQLQYRDEEFDCALNKVDRTKLYGFRTTEVVDENGTPCTLATLASDGRTLIPAGGVALAYVSPKGYWRDKSELTPVDLDGEEIEPVTSTFKNRVDLGEKATVEEFLDHNIRMAYALVPAGDEGGEEIPAALVEDLAGGSIYRFPFSYRGGLTADTAFVLGGDEGTVWMLVGKKTDIRLIGYEQQGAATVELDEDGDDDEGDLDFGMM